MWGVLPVKNFENAKTRLSPVLSLAERRTLFRLMVEDVLAAMTAASRLAGVLVLTNEPGVAALARRYGARVEGEPANEGQSPAVMRAMHLLENEGVSAALQLPGDIPGLNPAEIDRMVEAHSQAGPKAVTIVRAHDGRGSNALAVSPPPLIRFHFGHDSFGPHLAEARTVGVEPLVLDGLPGIALDIDTVEDLAKLLAGSFPSGDGLASRTVAWARENVGARIARS